MVPNHFPETGMSVTEKNFFQLLGLPEQFEVDLALLTENYRKLQRATHPDRFAHASERERLLAVQQASLVNDAYNTLKSPLLRAKYLLSLRGVDDQGESNTAMDPEFLMEQMELREALAEIDQSNDPQQAIAELLDEIDQKDRATKKALANAFSLDEAGLDDAARLVRQLQFFSKLMEEAEHIEARLEDS